MTYDHAIRIVRLAPADWGDDPTETVLYDGPADVQDGARTLDALGLRSDPEGQQEEATALVYLPPAAADPFALVRTGDSVETPLGLATVTDILHMDAALAIAVTESSPHAPEILA